VSDVRDRRTADPLRRALLLFGDRWTFELLRESFRGVTRYGMYQRRLGIARNVLAGRLAALVDEGLLERVRYRTDPDWYEYRLTEPGMALLPPVLAFKDWALRFYGGESDVRAHHHCGAELETLIVCRCCGEAVSGDDVTFEPSVTDPVARVASAIPTNAGPSKPRSLMP
jgi:DNA-binding HxlR family transcriptional regulator